MDMNRRLFANTEWTIEAYNGLLDDYKVFFFLPMIVIVKIPNGNIRFDIGLFWFTLTIWKLHKNENRL